jgi:hypothetical protein
MATNNASNYSPVNRNVIVGASNGGITSVAPSATSGVPLISQGASSDPAFGTAVVAGGGTGVTSNTAYAVLCGGTTTTNPIQSIASVGTDGQVLVSNGAGALPTFQNPAPNGGALQLIQYQTQTNVASIDFTSGINTGTAPLIWVLNGVVPVTGSPNLQMQYSTNGGSSWANSGYNTGINHNAVNSTTLTNNTSTTFAALGNTLSGISTYNATIYMQNVTVGNFTFYYGNASWFDTSVYRFGYLGGNLGSASVNAIRFLMSSGNITGNIGVYLLLAS